MARTPSAKTPAPPTPPDQMPLFYRQIAALDAARYAGKSLKTSIGFDFARNTNVVMLNAAEFEQAARIYPIVFASTPNPAALAILGLRQAENLFVDPEGNWRPNTYIPAYVRRYPFIFHRSDDGQQYTLCIDEAAGALEDGTERPLFVENTPSDITKGALEFCAAYQRDNEATREFVTELAKNQILVPNQAQITLPGGENLSLAGFELIDRAKFDALPSFVLTDWRKRGWLGLAYAHFISLACFGDLIERAGKKQVLM
ncbi:MAG: SapC family protein [Hyphomicrobiales bacterium]|nr:SapC family protein [Hyphomicrobiales bacterium]